MSGVGSPEVMKNLLLRSSTPASTEKVLLYLEGMQRALPDEGNKAGSTRSGRTAGSRVRSPPLKEGNGEDIRSDVQEGSEVTRTIPIHTTGFLDQEPDPDHEPGPNDPPGPKFESYGSSFGNFGPLPTGPSNGEMNGANDVASIVSHPNPFQQFGMTPATAAGVPLPASAATRSMPPATAKSRSIASGGAPGMSSPRAPSRVLSPGGERPLSPRSMASQGQSLKSRNTQKTQRTAYPPLPDSVMEDTATQRPPSPERSIAPSESASQAIGKRRAAAARAEAAAREREREATTSQRARSVRSATEVPMSPRQGAAAEYYANGGGSQRASSHRDARSQAPMSQAAMSQVAMPQAAMSQAPMSPRSHASHMQMPMSPRSAARTNDELHQAAALLSPTRSKRSVHDPDVTPTPSRPASPNQDLNAEEQQLVYDLLSRPSRSRTSYAMSGMAPSALEPEVQNSHFHDMELCQLLHALDQPMGEPVKKAVRKAVRARVKKLGMKNDSESIKAYRKSYHDHDPSVHLNSAINAVAPSSRRSAVGVHQEPPEWAKDLIDGFINMRDRLESLAPVIEKSLRSSRGSYVEGSRGYTNEHQQPYESEMLDEYPQTPGGGMHPGDESMFHTGDTGELMRESTHLHTLPGSLHHHDGSAHEALREEDEYEDEEDLQQYEDDTRGMGSDYMPQHRAESPGQQYLEEELYKLRVKPNTGGQSVVTHKTWEVARDDGEDYDEGDAQVAVTESGMPEIPDTNTGVNADRRSPPLPPLPQDNLGHIQGETSWQANGFAAEQQSPPWQRIHQRLLSWAIVWPMAELDRALNSTTRGMQVDEVALSIWSTQTYKRYVRAKMTDSPRQRVDRLFVPPNMADAISTAVYNGRHGDACGMLRDLWAPFGLEGIPRLLIVLAKHRNDANHWVVHRFSLPDGSLTTYDTFPERCLPDGRPLGWWFAIRIAWPDAIYPSPDHLMQKMVRLHRPLQLPIDNSVAAAGIWRNLLMGSRAERSLDLERLRDLINTEVKNLRQRKIMGKLSVGTTRPAWEELH